MAKAPYHYLKSAPRREAGGRLMYELSYEETVRRLSIALAIGLLIGLERGWQARDEGEGERAAGLRTHALAALLGGVWAVLAAPFGGGGLIALAIVFAGFVGVVTLFRYRETIRDKSFGATSVVAAMLCFALGALAAAGQEVAAAAAAVATALLLALKGPLHGWVRRLTWPEFRSALTLLAMSFVLAPTLPDRPIDPWGAVNPYELWLLTVLIGVIAFAGYVAVKLVGDERGVVVAGLAGGLASTTAATAAMSRLVRAAPAAVNILAASALFANAVMAPRLIAILGLVNPGLALRLALPLAAGGLVYVLAGLLLMRRGASSAATGDAEAMMLRNPLDIGSVLSFGALLAAIMVGAKLATQFAGAVGVYALATLSGLGDVDAIALTMARHGADEIGAPAAGLAILCAIAANAFAKTAMGFVIGGAGMGLRLLIASLAALAAGAGAFFFIPPLGL